MHVVAVYRVGGGEGFGDALGHEGGEPAPQVVEADRAMVDVPEIEAVPERRLVL